MCLFFMVGIQYFSGKLQFSLIYSAVLLSCYELALNSKVPACVAFLKLLPLNYPKFPEQQMLLKHTNSYFCHSKIINMKEIVLLFTC